MYYPSNWRLLYIGFILWQWPRNKGASANVLREIIFDDFKTKIKTHFIEPQNRILRLVTFKMTKIHVIKL